MKPIKLTMQAFGSYGKKTEIDFTKINQNIFLVTGDTGSGKSTIFDAIVFALYGEASSEQNKKDGVVLSSHFSGEKYIEPFVELIFSENGENYCVRRVPKHLKPKVRKEGFSDESEKVELTFPDGMQSPYKVKEINEKIIEIVGLTKSQFMQVAMIAQGEFMNLLRDSTKNKKQIFRKLFHTENYMKITEELNERSKAKEKQIGIIRTACQTELAHVSIPEEYEKAAGLEKLRNEIIENKRLDISKLHELMDELKLLIQELSDIKNEVNEQCTNTSSANEKLSNELATARQINEQFEFLEQANIELQECSEQKSEIDELKILVKEIEKSYEIKGFYDFYENANKMYNNTNQNLESQKNNKPQIEKEYLEAEKNYSQIKEQYEKIAGEYNKCKERVKTALTHFENITQKEKEVEALETQYKNACAQKDKIQSENNEIIELEKELKHTETILAEAGSEFEKYIAKKNKFEEISNELSEVEKEKEQLDLQKTAVKTALKKFMEINDVYNAKESEYTTKREMFLSVQAGVLASELQEGKPCPVCGSLSHPNPKKIEEEHGELTREYIQMLEEKLKEIKQKQESASLESNSHKKLLEEKTKNYNVHLQRFEETIKLFETTYSCEVMEENNELKNCIDIYSQVIEKEGLKKETDKKRYEDNKKELQVIEKRKEELSVKLNEITDKCNHIKNQLVSETASMQTMKKAVVEFENEQAARKLLSENEAQYTEAREQADKSKINADEKKREIEKCNALIQQYEIEIPKLREDMENKKKQYEELLADKKMSEEEWKKYTAEYNKDTEQLHAKIDTYNKKELEATTKKNAALKSIGDNKKVDVAAMEQRLFESKAAEEELRKKYNSILQKENANKEVYKNISNTLEERTKVVEEYNQLKVLYDKLSGKMAGSHVDIETFAQRYYMEQIIASANRHFQEMSAGQYLLELYDINKAGKGNGDKGLDLMVYSAVTGKRREIRTLSGGESFMAALALALGMSDKIQENTSAVNLDIMFIDEGFGSLDNNSRTEAIKVLKNMADSNRLIGIISHVTELKQEIDNQLIVTKDNQGSKVMWN